MQHRQSNTFMLFDKGDRRQVSHAWSSSQYQSANSSKISSSSNLNICAFCKCFSAITVAHHCRRPKIPLCGAKAQSLVSTCKRQSLAKLWSFPAIATSATRIQQFMSRIHVDASNIEGLRGIVNKSSRNKQNFQKSLNLPTPSPSLPRLKDFH